MKSLQEIFIAIDIEQNLDEFLQFFASHIYFGSDFDSYFKSKKKNKEIRLYTQEIPLFSLTERRQPPEALVEHVPKSKLKPDMLLELNNLPIMPIELETNIESGKQLKQLAEYFEYTLKIIKSRIGEDYRTLVNSLQNFHVFCFALSISKTMLNKIDYTDGQKAPIICFVCQNNWNKLPPKSILYRAFQLIDKLKDSNDFRAIFAAIDIELKNIPRVMQKFYFYDLLYKYGGEKMSKVLETGQQALGIPTQIEAIQDMDVNWVQDLSEEQVQALKPEQVQALKPEQIIDVLKKMDKNERKQILDALNKE